MYVDFISACGMLSPISVCHDKWSVKFLSIEMASPTRQYQPQHQQHPRNEQYSQGGYSQRGQRGYPAPGIPTRYPERKHHISHGLLYPC